MRMIKSSGWRATALASSAALVLTLMGARGAFAQPALALSPNAAVNIAGGTHTVTATLSGVEGACFELGACVGGGPSDGFTCKTNADCDPLDTCDGVGPDNDGSGVGPGCSSDADCADLANDDFCSFSGYPVGFQVTGQNSEDTVVSANTTDVLGNVSFTYSDTNGPGVDSITACADLFTDPGENTSACLAEVGFDDTDIGSNTVTKNWTAALAGTVDLEPLSAVNSVTDPAGTHKVTATVSGVARCTGGTNDGTLCADDFACTGGGTCSDKSGLTVGFNINSGPNKSDQGWHTTDATGAVSLTYTDNGGAGLDLIQACLDADPFSPGSPDENFACTGGTNDGTACFSNADCTGGGVCAQTVANCIADASDSEPDFASNIVSKRWDPTLKLENLDAGATLATGVTTYTSGAAYNPVGSSHTVRATISGAAKICFGGANHRNACPNGNSDCTDGDTCGLAGYPVFFGVLAGSQNPGDIPGFVNTDSSGHASVTYVDANGAGIDTIQACVDADLTEGIPDDTSFSECLGDYPAEADIPSNTVTKYWLAKFVTGGGKVANGKAWNTFGGTVGQKPNSTAITGEWEEVAHAAKGGNTHCHWNTFPSFALSCSLANCGAQPNTAVFTTSGGGASCGATTVKIVDGQKKPDTIGVSNASNPALNVPASSLVSGNFTIHK